MKSNRTRHRLKICLFLMWKRYRTTLSWVRRESVHGAHRISILIENRDPAERCQTKLENIDCHLEIGTIQSSTLRAPLDRTSPTQQSQVFSNMSRQNKYHAQYRYDHSSLFHKVRRPRNVQKEGRWKCIWLQTNVASEPRQKWFPVLLPAQYWG